MPSHSLSIRLQIVLMCEECKKKLIILSSKEDWRSRCTILVCECEHELTLDGRTDGETLTAS
jgi:hypothetical protein